MKTEKLTDTPVHWMRYTDFNILYSANSVELDKSFKQNSPGFK